MFEYRGCVSEDRGGHFTFMISAVFCNGVFLGWERSRSFRAPVGWISYETHGMECLKFAVPLGSLGARDYPM